jgi:G3E family GTPase
MQYHNIPTNLIIGFLGVGKTTAIRHLLSQIPDGERWCVLVNEFGEVGIDGALLEAEEISVQEVTGGCLCCVAANGLQIGLTRLIREQNPDRILIEPTGLGHPRQILSQLTSQSFKQVLRLHATIGLVDARQLSNPRYREHPTYQDQIQLADVLVATKADLYHEKDHQAFEQLTRTLESAKQHLATAENGRLQKTWLDYPRTEHKALFPDAHQIHQQEHTHEHRPQGDWIRIENVNDGYHGCGWVIDKNRIFNAEPLVELLETLGAERSKGIFHTDKGWLAMNLANGEIDIRETKDRADNRLEIIHFQAMDWGIIDRGLKQELLTKSP